MFSAGFPMIKYCIDATSLHHVKPVKACEIFFSWAKAKRCRKWQLTILLSIGCPFRSWSETGVKRGRNDRDKPEKYDMNAVRVARETGPFRGPDDL
jgi:hypothetical protein